MKNNIILCFVLLLSISNATNAQQKTTELIGTWELTSYKYGNNELKNVTDSTHKVKFITQTSFIWVQYKDKDKIVFSSAGGTYTYSGETYVENIKFSGMMMSGFIGNENTFKVKIEGNKMYLSGTLANGYKIEEVWKKLN